MKWPGFCDGVEEGGGIANSSPWIESVLLMERPQQCRKWLDALRGILEKYSLER